MHTTSAVAQVLVGAGVDLLIGNQCRPVEQVQRLPADEFLVDVHECDLADDPAELQRGRGTRANQSAATDDRDLHGHPHLNELNARPPRRRV